MLTVNFSHTVLTQQYFRPEINFSPSGNVADAWIMTFNNSVSLLNSAKWFTWSSKRCQSSQSCQNGRDSKPTFMLPWCSPSRLPAQNSSPLISAGWALLRSQFWPETKDKIRLAYVCQTHELDTINILKMIDARRQNQKWKAPPWPST